MSIEVDEKGLVHLSWELEGVTAKMLDWWWCNMEKGFPLWHPQEHKDFYWIKRPRHGDAIGAIQVAPQRWADGRVIKPHIKWEDVSVLEGLLVDLVRYDHVLVAAALSLTEEDFREDATPVGYRIHQWEATEGGVRGLSTAIPTEAEPTERLRDIWAKHCAEEIKNFEVFLPKLYSLWQVVDDPEINPYFCFRVVKGEGRLRYAARAKGSSEGGF